MTYAGARWPARDRAEYEGSRYRRQCRRTAVDEKPTVKEAAGIMNWFDFGCLIARAHAPDGFPLFVLGTLVVLGGLTLLFYGVLAKPRKRRSQRKARKNVTPRNLAEFEVIINARALWLRLKRARGKALNT